MKAFSGSCRTEEEGMKMMHVAGQLLIQHWVRNTQRLSRYRWTEELGQTSVDREGNTALVAAAADGHSDVVEFELDRGSY